MSFWNKGVKRIVAAPPEVGKRPELRFSPGGLMRCCTTSIPEDIEDTWYEGQELTCSYEDKVTMVINDGTLKWVGRDYVPNNS